MKFIKVNFFTKSADKGYPALIVTGCTGQEDFSAIVANWYEKKLDFQTVVFVLPAVSKDVDVALRFFTPGRTELKLCGHGTLAVASYLLAGTNKNNLTIEILANNNRQLVVKKSLDGLLQFASSHADIIVKQFTNTQICALLNLQSTMLFDARFEICCASIGSPKLLIPVFSKEVLTKISPNYDLIKELSAQGVNGVYVYAKEIDSTFSARSFNPSVGNDEEIVNSLGAAALSSIMIKRYKASSPVVINHGHNLGMPSQVVVNQEDDQLMIGGYAVNGPELDEIPAEYFKTAPAMNCN